MTMTPRNVHLLGEDWRGRLATFQESEYFDHKLRHDIVAATSLPKGSFLQRNIYKDVPGDDMPRAMFAFPTIEDTIAAAAKIAFLMASPIGEYIWGVSVERRIKGEGYVVFLKCVAEHVVAVVETTVDVLEYCSEYSSIPIFGKQNRKLSSVDVARRHRPAPFMFLDN